MNIALIGYGKMGKEVDRIASERGSTIVCRMTSQSSLNESELQRADVAIHFARPDSVVAHVQRLASLKKNMVIGTTGWHDEIDNVRSVVNDAKIGVVYASNFSIGVQIFFHLTREAAKLMNSFAEYDVYVQEAHHKEKMDSPSGTALAVAKILLDHIKRKKTILSDPPQGKIRPDQLQITSTRAGTIVGTHTITFDSLADVIELRHTAKNRTGFALGALLAAEWIKGKRGLFTMDDVVADIVH